jgi:hypothetical protein
MTMWNANYVPRIPDDETEVGIQTVSEKQQTPITLSDLPPPGAMLQRSLTERELQALKQLGPKSINLLNEISKDLLPVWGEARAMDYTNQEIEGFKQAIGEGDVGGTITHGIGIPLMSAGSLPWWLGGAGGVGLGYMYRKGIMEGYRNLTSRFRKPQYHLADAHGNRNLRNVDTGGTGPRAQDYLSEIEIARLGGGIERSAYIQWLRGLPENRMSGTERMINTNLDEFFSSVLPNADLMRDLTATYRSTVTGVKKVDDYKQMKKGIVEARKQSDQTLAQKNVPEKITEKLNFGETATPIRVGAQKNVSEFMGSRAYDVIAAENWKNMNTAQITSRLINLIKSGKINKEELFDAGILKLNDKMEPIGGSLVSMPKEFKNVQISKQDILKMIKDNPSARLKVNTYGGGHFFPDGRGAALGDEFYDLYASTDRMGNSVKMILEEQIFKTTNTAQRGQLIRLQEKIKQLESGLNDAANVSSSTPTAMRGWGDDLEILTTALPNLPDGAQQILRGYITNIQKLRPYVNPQKKRDFKGTTKHDRITTKGGYDYQEKVIYLDESIPLNTKKGRAVYTAHFPESNPTVHIRYKTRYNDKGQPIYAIEEIQSDTLQKYWGSEGTKEMRELMSSPYGKTLVESIIKRKMNEFNEAMSPLLNASKKRSLTDSEIKTLQKLEKDKSFLRKYFVKSELMDEAAINKMGQMIKKDIDKVDWFPYMRSYWELGMKAMVDDAIRTGKRGISIIPVHKNTHHTKDKGHYLYYGDHKGTKLKSFDQEALPPPGKTKSSSLAVYPKTLEKIAKQIKADHGITLNVKRTKMFNEPSSANRPYQIIDQEGEIIASFKTKANRDYILDKKNAGKEFPNREFSPKDITAGPKSNKEAFWAYTLEIPENAAKQLLKKKMRSYRVGGLVAIEPKREYFAPIF